MNYYNEWDKDAAAWLRELIKAGLIPDGEVDDRSITEVKAHELTSFRQAHFFAGIGGWALALQLAGIDPNENTDTGSCPCQPFSGTGKQMGFADPRHLWPAFRRVIGKRQPAKIYGEQVASKLGREWLSRVFSDLAFMGYAGSGADLCSAGVGSPNIRQRLYWVGDSVRTRPFSAAQRGADCREKGGGPRHGISDGSSAINRLEHSTSDGWQQRGSKSVGWGITGGCSISGMAEPNSTLESGRIAEQSRKSAGTPGAGTHDELGRRSDISGLGHADHARWEGRIIRWHGGYERAAGEASVAGPATLEGFWGIAVVYCRDEKWRRIEPGSFPMADGIPSRVGPLPTELRKLGRSSIALARANRNLRLKGYGNAINPHVAAQFILAAESARTGLGRVNIGLDLDAEDSP